MRSWHAVVDCRDTPGTAPGPCPGSPSSCRVVEMAAGLRGTVGVTEQLSAGLPAGPLAAGSYPSWACPPPSRFCEVWVTCLLRCRQTSWNAPTFLCRTVPRQAPTQWARCRPGGLVVCGGWPLLSWWRLPVSPILQMGKQRPGSSVTQPGLWHLSCGAPGQEPVGTARGGGVEADTPTAPCPPPAGAGSAPGADPAPGQHVTWAGVPGWHPSATAGRGNSGGQEMQRWATRAAWSALNPVPLFSRTNTTMLLTKSSRPSGECGVAGGPGPGRLRPGAPRQHLGKRRRSGCGSSARGVQAAVRLAGAP